MRLSLFFLCLTELVERRLDLIEHDLDLGGWGLKLVDRDLASIWGGLELIDCDLDLERDLDL